METGSDKKQPPKDGCRPKTSVRPKVRSKILAYSSPPMFLGEMAEKKFPKKAPSGRKATYAELFAPVPSSSSSNEEKSDITMFDPVNIRAFIRKMERKERLLKEQYKITEPSDDLANVSICEQPTARDPAPSTSRGDSVKNEVSALVEKNKALEEVVHGYDSFLEGAVSHADTFRERGDICTSAVLDAMKGMSFAPNTDHQNKEKKADSTPTPTPGGSGLSTSRRRGGKRNALKKLQAKKKEMEEIVHGYDSFIEDAISHADEFRDRGDVFTAAVLDSIKGKDLASPFMNNK